LFCVHLHYCVYADHLVTSFLVASVQVIILGSDTEFSTEDLYFILLTLCSPNYSYAFQQYNPN